MEVHMRLYIRQKVFSFADKFTVYREDGSEAYRAEGEIFTFGKKLHVCDTEGHERLYIEQRIFSFRPRYYIYTDGQLSAEVIKRFSFFVPRFEIAGPGLEAEGDFFAHEYRIFSGERTVATVSRQWFTFGDSYMLETAEEDTLLSLGILLVFDCMMADSAAASSASSSH